MERRQAGKWASRQAGKADRKKGKKICKTAAQQDRRKAGQQAGQTDTKKIDHLVDTRKLVHSQDCRFNKVIKCVSRDLP